VKALCVILMQRVFLAGVSRCRHMVLAGARVLPTTLHRWLTCGGGIGMVPPGRGRDGGDACCNVAVVGRAASPLSPLYVSRRLRSAATCAYICYLRYNMLLKEATKLPRTCGRNLVRRGVAGKLSRALVRDSRAAGRQERAGALRPAPSGGKHRIFVAKGGEHFLDEDRVCYTLYKHVAYICFLLQLCLLFVPCICLCCCMR